MAVSNLKDRVRILEAWIRDTCSETDNRPIPCEECVNENCPVNKGYKGYPTRQDEVRKVLLERCKDCVPYAPMILPEVCGYLECEESGDWSGWKIGK